MATNNARFTINGTPAVDANGNRGYDVESEETLVLTLEKNPASAVLTVTYEVADALNTSAPLNSLFDSELTFEENDLKAYTPPTPNDTATIVIPETIDISAYLIRATVITAQGAEVFERLIVFRVNGLRMTVPAETTQYSQRGWSDAINELTKYVTALAEGGEGVLVTSLADGFINSFPAGERRIFHSDGTASGGVWTALSATDVASAFADDSIGIGKLNPEGTAGQTIQIVDGVATWVTPEAGGSEVANVTDAVDGTINSFPDGSRRIFHSDGSTAGGVWTALTATDIDAAFADESIGISKLNPEGTDGQIIQIVDGAITWVTPAVSDEGSLVTSSNDGYISDFDSGIRRIFHSDGSTAGGLWSALTLADVSTSFQNGSITIGKLSPTSGEEGQTIQLLGEAKWPTWVDPPTGFIYWDDEAGSVQFGTRWLLGTLNHNNLALSGTTAFDFETIITTEANWPTETGIPDPDVIMDLELVFYVWCKQAQNVDSTYGITTIRCSASWVDGQYGVYLEFRLIDIADRLMTNDQMNIYGSLFGTEATIVHDVYRRGRSGTQITDPVNIRAKLFVLGWQRF